MANGCSQNSTNGRLSAVTKDCEIENNKVKFESIFCEVLTLSLEGEESNEFQSAPVTSSDLVAYLTPSGQLVYLPKRAIPSFGTKTNLPIPASALVAFTLDNEQYVAQYKKPRGLSTDWEFICYKNKQTGLAYSFENQPSSLVNNNNLGYSVCLGFGAAFVLEKGSSLSTLLNVVESFDLLIPQGSRILGLNLSLPLSSCLALPFLVTSDQNKYYGSGVLSPTLPAVRVTPITLPTGVIADIDHALPRGVTGGCNVYVIWGPNFRDYGINHPIEVAKYGMTCQADCNNRPHEQVVQFNKEHNVNTFGYKVIFTNLDKDTAHLLERSLTAVYVITNEGRLPPKHNLPCFKKDDPLNLAESRKTRKDRAEEFNTEMKKKYGEKK